jgi:hypothetical protein
MLGDLHLSRFAFGGAGRPSTPLHDGHMHVITSPTLPSDDLWIRLLVVRGIEAAQQHLHDASGVLQHLVEECAWTSSGMRSLADAVGDLTRRVAIERANVAQLLWVLR